MSCDRAPLLAARAVDVALGDTVLVRGLDLNVMPGERWCILGPNGVGKTTLLQTLAGLRAPCRGEVSLRGDSYAALGPRRSARQRALLTQGRRFSFRMPVRACVMLGRHPHIDRFEWPGRHDHERALDAIRIMELTALEARDVLELSGGEQQRVHIAMLLAQDPALFLLDEPTTHLDLKHQAALFSHLRNLCDTEGRAVVFSTHDLGVAAAFATHALLLCDSCVVRSGPCAALLEPTLLSQVFDFPLTAVETAAGKAFVPRW